MRLYVVSHLNAKATQLATGWDLREDSASDSQPFSTGKINGAHARKRGSVSAGFLLSVEQMSSVKAPAQKNTVWRSPNRKPPP